VKILVLGGTAFLGRAFVESALEKGHQVTLFNRGQRNPDLFPDLETIRGDRSQDVSALQAGGWDAVFDACGYFPRVVKMSVEACLPWAERYLFISSISVFKDAATPNQNEEAELATLADPTVEEITGETYGGLKVLCEDVVNDHFKERALIVRPGLIVGPNDYTDRFTYWPTRMSRGGQILVPDIKEQPVQIIDVRDVADFSVTLLENRACGTFNTTGPQIPYTYEALLQACAKGTDAEFVWVGTAFLTEHQVQPWSELPLALDYDGSGNGMLQVDVSKAVAAGLKLRPLAQTVGDTRDWAVSRPADTKLKAGLSPEREAELLQLWRAGR
jgi:2'-hydroxyisoflavone reductase